MGIAQKEVKKYKKIKYELERFKIFFLSKNK
jgi:hypothetical protein